MIVRQLDKHGIQGFTLSSVTYKNIYNSHTQTKRHARHREEIEVVSLTDWSTRKFEPNILHVGRCIYDNHYMHMLESEINFYLIIYM